MKNKKSCKHKNQERIDYGTNKCLDCNRFISTLMDDKWLMKNKIKP